MRVWILGYERSSLAYDHLHTNQPRVLHEVLTGSLKPKLAGARDKDDETKARRVNRKEKTKSP